MEEKKLSENRELENKQKKNKSKEKEILFSFIKNFEKNNIDKFSNNKSIYFSPGDTLRVEEIQKVFTEKKQPKNRIFEGTCIAIKNRAWSSSFTLRKIFYIGGGIEKSFKLHSPYVIVKKLKTGCVRRSKLYYLRDKIGKKAKIREKI